MPRSIDRRHVLALAVAIGPLLALPGPAGAETEDGRVLGDVVLGAEDAPVTVIEYASFTCPHCAAFHRQTWPEFKEQYVDEGKVRFIMREVYFDAQGLWVSMLARCAGEDAFYPMVDQFLKKQDEWARAEDLPSAIQKIGRINGLSRAQMRSCLTDQDYAETLVAKYKEQAGADQVESTPTFFINGEKHTGAMGFEEFSALVDAHL